MVEKAEIEDEHICAEPQAGQGGLADLFGNSPLCIELMPENAQILRDKGYEVIEGDFLECDFPERFDRIVANPPFTKNQDIDHIRHMYKCLKKKGRIVSCASLSWKQGSQKKQVAFREWLEEIGAEVEELDGGEFKESGTNIKACIITINR